MITKCKAKMPKNTLGDVTLAGRRKLPESAAAIHPISTSDRLARQAPIRDTAVFSILETKTFLWHSVQNTSYVCIR
jgi:hypothetical protein